MLSPCFARHHDEACRSVVKVPYIKPYQFLDKFFNLSEH